MEKSFYKYSCLEINGRFMLIIIKKAILCKAMKLNNYEKRELVKRFKNLKKQLIRSLENMQINDYLNTLNSREYLMLEQTLVMNHSPS